MSKTWYNIITSDDGKKAEIFIFEEIGFWGITATDFIRDFKAIEASEIDIHINSPGGEVMDGTAIYNVIRNSKKNITMIIDGLAASMASVIAMAGDKVIMADNSYFMIHNPAGLAWGEVEEMEKMIEILNNIKQQLITAYENKTGMDRERIAAMMDDETWLSAAEAQDMGFIDEVIKGQKKVALFDVEKYGFKNSGKYNLLKNLEHSQAIPAATPAPPAAKEPVQNKTKEDKTMTREEFKNQHADLHNEIFTDGIAEGIKEESARIAAIHNLGIVGHDDLVKKAIEDHNKTAGDLAAEVLAAQNKAKKTELQNRVDESDEVNDVPAGTGADQTDKVDAEAIKARAKAIADRINNKFKK